MPSRKRRPLAIDSEIIEFKDYGPDIERIGRYDPNELIFDWAPKAIRASRAMREKFARSYRGFKVGVVSVDNNPDFHKSAALVGANYKPTPEDDKLCGEMYTVERAKELHFPVIQAVFVAGTTNKQQIFEVNRIRTPTLWACRDCVNGYLDPSTLVVSVGAGRDENFYEVHTALQLARIYESPLKDEPRTFVIHDDPEFSTFATAKVIYLDRTAGMPIENTQQNRLDRAEAVVASLMEAAQAA